MYKVRDFRGTMKYLTAAGRPLNKFLGDFSEHRTGGFSAVPLVTEIISVPRDNRTGKHSKKYYNLPIVFHVFVYLL